MRRKILPKLSWVTSVQSVPGCLPEKWKKHITGSQILSDKGRAIPAKCHPHQLFLRQGRKENKQTSSLFRAVIPVVPGWSGNTDNNLNTQPEGAQNTRDYCHAQMHLAKFRGWSERLSGRQWFNKLLVALSGHWQHPALHPHVVVKGIPEGLSPLLCRNGSRELRLFSVAAPTPRAGTSSHTHTQGCTPRHHPRGLGLFSAPTNPPLQVLQHSLLLLNQAGFLKPNW